MLDWLFGRKRRDEEFLKDLARAATEGDRLHRLRQAIATVSPEPLTGKDATDNAAAAAALLMAAIVSKTISAIEDDDDRFVTGIFVFVFSDYFAHLLGGSFEMASSIAVMKVVGVAEFERGFNTIQESYNQMAHSQRNVLEAIGKTCEAWFKSPTASEFERLTELFNILRSRVAQK